MQIRQSKEQFNNEVMAMKTRKAMLLQELEDIQLQLIDIQVHTICLSFWAVDWWITWLFSSWEENNCS